MKLYDFLRNNPGAQRYVSMEQPRTVIAIDNVAAYAREIPDKQKWWELALNRVSPWPWAFYEYAFQDKESGLKAQRGIAVNQAERDDRSFAQTIFITDVLQHGRGHLEMVLFGSVVRTVSPAGEMVSISEVDPHGAPHPVSLEQFVAMAWPADVAMTFAHCKNVSMQEHRTPPKVAKKRAKAGKPIGTTYKTLVIDPMKETLRTEGNIEKNGLKKALHICRGHFATYTEDKPLFGKVTGTFWKPMHVRGNKKRGEVKKDYAIKAPG